MGAGQAMSSHLRGWLVTSVQELLGAEHVARVGHPVHAVQDVDLAEGALSGSTLSSPALAQLSEARLLTTAPQLLPFSTRPHPRSPHAAISIPTIPRL